MPRLKNPHTVSPDDVIPGDVFAVIVTCYVSHEGRLRFYRCQYPNPDTADGIPQGSYYGTSWDNVRLQDLFPTVRDAVNQGVKNAS